MKSVLLATFSGIFSTENNAGVRHAVPFVAALGMATVLPLAVTASALALTGGKDVDRDDIGARASVALTYRYQGEESLCGGAVFQDRYVLTAAHCFTDREGSMVRPAKGWEVLYWGSENGKREVRRVEKITIHENYLQREKAAYPAPQPWDDQNFPIQHEDIAVLEISGTHPAGATSVFVPSIENEYTSSSRNSTWFYVYGARANGSGWRLQRALVAEPGAVERIIPGRTPDIMYAVRKMVINTGGIPGPDSFMKDVSICSGDSGTGVFLVESDPKTRYDDNPEEFPTAIALKDGRPILVGLNANVALQGLVTDVVEDKDGCGRDQGSDAMIATRIDFFHDWILSKTDGGH